MKVLILSVTAGNGHISASRAVRDELAARGADTKIIDVLENNPLYFWFADKGYLFAVKYLLPLYNLAFRNYRKANPENRYRSSVTNTVLSCIARNYREICEFRPDVIYCPHFYGGAIVTYLKTAGYPLPAKTIINALDYCLSPYWETGIKVDKFVVTKESDIPDAVKLGYTREQVENWGVPIKKAFLQTYDKREERIRLGLDPDKPTFIVMFGGGYASGGTKIFRKLIRALGRRTAQIIKINGHDRRGYRAASRAAKRLPGNLRIVNVGFTDEIERYIAASDVAITKCGGLSSTELAGLGVPILSVEPLPEQEKQNLAYWKSVGVATSFHTARKLCREVEALIDHPEALEKMQHSALAVRTDALSQVTDWILAQPPAGYDIEDLKKIDFKKVEPDVRRVLKAAHRASKKDRRAKKKARRREK